jgi:hypothetical protein
MAGLALLHTGAIGCLLLVPLPALLRTAAMTAIAINLACSLRRTAGPYGPRALRRIRVEAQGIALGLGDEPAARFLDCRLEGCFVHPWLTILRLRAVGRDRRLHVALGRDALSTEDGRRLRQYLRQRAPGARLDQPV